MPLGCHLLSSIEASKLEEFLLNAVTEIPGAPKQRKCVVPLYLLSLEEAHRSNWRGVSR